MTMSLELVHCAFTRMLASRQEQTTTLYCMSFLKGGIENLSFSTTFRTPSDKIAAMRFDKLTAVRLDYIWNFRKGPVGIIEP